MSADHINATFELVGAAFAWTNFRTLRRDRKISGVFWPTAAFNAGWGLWNIFYYPALSQWWSFAGGIVLCAGNTAWVILAIRLNSTSKHR